MGFQILNYFASVLPFGFSHTDVAPHNLMRNILASEQAGERLNMAITTNKNCVLLAAAPQSS